MIAVELVQFQRFQAIAALRTTWRFDHVHRLLAFLAVADRVDLNLHERLWLDRSGYL